MHKRRITVNIALIRENNGLMKGLLQRVGGVEEDGSSATDCERREAG